MPPDASTPSKSAPRTWRRKLAYALIALAAGILLLSVLTRRTPDAVRIQLPASLTDLVPAFLPAIPIDPATDQPLRFRPLNPGYVVYGLGTDGEDNQGNTTGKPGTRNAKTDVGFTVER